MRVLRTPGTVITVFRNLITVSNTFIPTVGAAAVLRVLWQFRRFISAPGTTNKTLNTFKLFAPNLNQFVVDAIINSIAPYWKECLAFIASFKKLLNILIVLTFLNMFPQLIGYILRFIISTVGGSFFILWTDYLSNIPTLYNFAMGIVSYLRDFYFETIFNPKLNGVPRPETNVVNKPSKPNIYYC